MHLPRAGAVELGQVDALPCAEQEPPGFDENGHGRADQRCLHVRIAVALAVPVAAAGRGDQFLQGQQNIVLDVDHFAAAMRIDPECFPHASFLPIPVGSGERNRPRGVDKAPAGAKLSGGTGLIAQLAERIADNDEVPGSIPGGPRAEWKTGERRRAAGRRRFPVFSFHKFLFYGAVAQLGERLVCNQ